VCILVKFSEATSHSPFLLLSALPQDRDLRIGGARAYLAGLMQTPIDGSLALEKNLFPVKKQLDMCAFLLISTKRLFSCACMLLIAATSHAMAQQVAVSIGSGSTTPGSALSVNISLSSTGGSGPAAVQWTMSYSSPAVTSVSIVAGWAATAAQKSATCVSTSSSTTCVVSGLNQTVISDGVLAVATFTVSPNAATSFVPVQLAVVASTPAGVAIPSAGTGGTIFVSGATQPTVSGLTCAPVIISGPGASVCTINLSAPAPAGGMSVVLASNNSNVVVPATVNIPAAASSGGFTVAIAAVLNAQTATVSSSTGSITRTQALTLNPGTTALRNISGTITPSLSGSGTTVTLTGGITTTTDSSGNYTFSGLVNGSYTLTPSKSGYTFTPPTQSVILDGSNLTSVNFTAVPSTTPGTVTIDAQVRQDQTTASSVIASPRFSTASNGELLLAFIAAGKASDTGTTVNSVSGGGLTWARVVRTHTQKGTAEIWRAFSQTSRDSISVSATLSGEVTSSMTVMSFAGVDPSGAYGSGAIGAIGFGSGSSGTASASLFTTRQNSLVVGVGNDPNRAVARTAGTGQTLVHQYLDPMGGTYWVQISSRLAPLPSGSNITINESSPADDPYNLSIAEILAGPPAGTRSAATSVLSNLAGLPVTNACSPGGEVRLTGTGFTGQAPQAATGTPLPTQLAGARVIANGNPMPLLYAADTRVVFECPVLPPGTPLNITLEGADGFTSSPAATVMKDVAPELFTLDGTNQGVILLGDTNQTVLSRPARPGESVTIYVAGLGEFDDSPSGTAVLLKMSALSKNQIRVVVEGLEIETMTVEPSASNVGLTKVVAQLPMSIPAGDAVPLFVRVILADGTALESNEVTLAIDGDFSK